MNDCWKPWQREIRNNFYQGIASISRSPTTIFYYRKSCNILQSIRKRFHPSKVVLEFTYRYGREPDEERKITMVRQSRFHAHARKSRNAFRDATHMYTKRLENYWPTNRPAILTFASLSSGKEKKEKKQKIEWK